MNTLALFTLPFRQTHYSTRFKDVNLEFLVFSGCSGEMMYIKANDIHDAFG